MTPGMQVKRLILRSGSRRRVFSVLASLLVLTVGDEVTLDDGVYTVADIEDVRSPE